MSRLLVVFGFCFYFAFQTLPGQAQLLQLTEENDFKRCTSEAFFNLKAKNESDKSAFQNFRIRWGDGTEDAFFSSTPPAHKYMDKGHYVLEFYGQRQDGSWQGPVTYDVYYDTGTPTVKLEAGGEGGLCVNEEISFRVMGLKSNLPQTHYHLDFGDGLNKDFEGSDYEGDEVEIRHRYDRSGCVLAPGKEGKIWITLTLTNICGEEFGPTFGPYMIAERVKMNFDLPEKECTGNPLDFNLYTGYEPADCMQVELRWDVTDLSDPQGKTEEDVNLPYVFEKPGEYKVRAYGIRNKATCSEGEKTDIVRIIQRVKAVASPLNSEICVGSQVALNGSASEGEEIKYRWDVLSGKSDGVNFIPDSRTADPVAAFTKPGSYQLRLTVDNGCSRDETVVEVVVKGNPRITAFRALPDICPGQNLDLESYISYDWTWEGNPHVPHWSVEPAEGAEFLLHTEEAEYPILRFTKPGTYTVKVRLDGAGCGEEPTLQASQQIVVYDPEIRGEITAKKLDVCENAPIDFVNDMEGVDVQTQWVVTDADGRAVEGVYSRTQSANGKQVSFVFTRYGNYKIRAEVKAACDQTHRDFSVVVRRAPEVYFRDFPAVICPETPFLPGDYIDFYAYGNENTAFEWDIRGGDDQPATLEGKNSRHPKLIFRKWGSYTLRLKITNPTVCASPSTEITKTFDVSNPLLDLKINPDRTILCAGEQVHFVNNSDVGVAPDYYWGISPEGYHFLSAEGAASPDPVIVFDEPGIYNVTAVVNGVCRPETRSYTLTVQKDPEVTLDTWAPMCPGVLTLTDETVHYTWNDSWKSGAESTRRVEWKLVSAPADADCTPPESVEWNALYPRLNLNTPGRYVLQVETKSDALCGGTQKTATREIEVYDPRLILEAGPVESEEVIRLSAGQGYQVVEGRPVAFFNRSQGVGLQYRWTVTPAGEVEISDASAAEPTLVFHKFGRYKVRVDFTGTCDADFREYDLVVKGIPKFRFEPIANRCDNWGEIDIRDYLSCDSAGSTSISCRWDISPRTGYTLTEGRTSDMFYKIQFHTAGTYTLTLKAQAEYGGVQTVSRTVNVLRSGVEAKAELSQTMGCTDDDFVVVAQNRSDGDSLTYVWRVSPEEGREVVAEPEKLTLTLKEKGDYRIYLEAQNICARSVADYEVHAYSKPAVEVLGDTDLGRECELGYVFAGNEHVGVIEVNGDPLVHVRWRVSPAGSHFQEGSSAGEERPRLTFEGGKEYTITGEFKNQCRDTVKVVYTLGVDKYEPVILMPDTAVCALTPAFPLRGIPSGGTWQASDPAYLVLQDGKYAFSPGQDEDRSIRLYYERGNGKCMSRDSFLVTVWQLPEVEAGRDTSACINWDPIELKGGNPGGGRWMGPGVKDGQHFFPGNVVAGKYTLAYEYLESQTGCANRDSIRMTVHELPDAAFTTAARHCRERDSLFIPVQSGVGNRYHWDFGDGTTGTSVDAIAHRYNTAGLYPVTARCTSVYACISAPAMRQVEVMNPPLPAVFDVDYDKGCGPLDVRVSIRPSDYEGDHLDLRYAWDFGNGKTDDRLQPDPAGFTYPDALFDTTYVIRLKTYNICGTRDTSRDILVYSSPVALFHMNPEEEGCDPLELTLINVSTGSGNTYEWTFGDGEVSAEKHPAPHIYRTGARTSRYPIRLMVANRCHTSEHRDTIIVKPNTLLARFTKDKTQICEGNTVCFTNFSTDTSSTVISGQYWDFGDGKRSTDWHVCHQFDSVGRLPVVVTVENGCAKASFTDTVVVHPVPRLSLLGAEPACEDESFRFQLTSDRLLKTVVWEMGDGGREEGMDIRHVYAEPGRYQARVEVALAEIPSCSARDSVSVEVWSKPRVQILPLDTMACSPLDYRPVVVATGYDYFRWDYGDGGEVTSEEGHTYENDTNFIREYALTAYVENNLGCREEHHGRIRVYPSPRARWTREISYGRPEKVRFINLSRDYTECIWYLPDGQVVHSPEDQELVFEEEDIYPVALTVVNEYGCRDSIYEDYRSYMGGLYFPNTFIPHSTNPEVNRFTGIGMGLQEYRLEIFDMYGNKVWETTALNGGMPAEGWDGCNREGKLLPQGMYMWRAKAIFFSGDVWTGDNNRSGKPQTTQGAVLLLRE